MYRIGNGLDFHKITLDQNKPLVLGGAIIDSEYAIIGHSDGDIILHAIADAILGAAALGDIGQYFPDTDPSLKGMDSAIILEKSLRLTADKGYYPVNIDCTVMAQKIKMAPHNISIRKSLSKLTGMPVDNISLKATTTEKMGFIGRDEGIGVMATVLLAKREIQ